MVENYKKWKEETEDIVSKDDFLNGLPFERSSTIQQMLYLLYKKIESLESTISGLGAQIVILESTVVDFEDRISELEKV